jgi:carboxymethylenebutenolidase
MDGDRLVYWDERGLTRRTALGAALGSTFALAVQPVQAQTRITTPADGLTAGAVKVKTTDGKEMDAYRAMPATGSFGAILVVQEIWACMPISPTCAAASPRSAITPLHLNSTSGKAIPK